MSSPSKQRTSAASTRGPAPLALNIGLAMAEYSLMQARGQAQDHLLPQMLDGIRKYDAHLFRRPDPRYDVIWSAGTVRLLRHTNATGSGRPIVLIPSLINRPAILDLLPRRSFMR